MSATTRTPPTGTPPTGSRTPPGEGAPPGAEAELAAAEKALFAAQVEATEALDRIAKLAEERDAASARRAELHAARRQALADAQAGELASGNLVEHWASVAQAEYVAFLDEAAASPVLGAWIRHRSALRRAATAGLHAEGAARAAGLPVRPCGVERPGLPDSGVFLDRLLRDLDARSAAEVAGEDAERQRRTLAYIEGQSDTPPTYTLDDTT